MYKEADCNSFKLDAWGICHYKIDCMLPCINNCYRDHISTTEFIRRQTNMDLSDISTPPSTDWLNAPEYPSHHLETDNEYEARRLLYYAKIASRYPTTTPVVVGEVKDIWEDYVTSTLHAVITYPVKDLEFTGFKRVECHIVLQSPSEVVQLARSIHEGRLLVVDSTTKQILAAHSCFY